MSYFKEFDAIERTKEKYDKDIKQLENDLYKKKNTKFPDEESENFRKEEVSKLKQQIENRKNKYQQDLRKGYKREFEKIKSSSLGYGEESNAVDTQTQIEHLEGKSKTEVQMKVNQFKKNGNSQGLDLLNRKMMSGELPTVNMKGHKSFDEKVEELDNYWKGKYRVTTDRLGGQTEALGELKEEVGLL